MNSGRLGNTPLGNASPALSGSGPLPMDEEIHPCMFVVIPSEPVTKEELKEMIEQAYNERHPEVYDSNGDVKLLIEVVVMDVV